MFKDSKNVKKKKQPANLGISVRNELTVRFPYSNIRQTFLIIQHVKAEVVAF